jgi:hypothetical protein
MGVVYSNCARTFDNVEASGEDCPDSLHLHRLHDLSLGGGLAGLKAPTQWLRIVALPGGDVGCGERNAAGHDERQLSMQR